MKYLKLFFRLLLGLFMTYAGFSHLTFNRLEFVAQVPTWLQFSESFTDFVVLASGVVEIALGLGMLLLWKKKAVVRITLTEPPVGKRKQYDKNGEEMKWGRME
jgi:uncharacterized membrane protein